MNHIEPTVIEGWTIHVSNREWGFASKAHAKRYCQALDDGTCEWSIWGLSNVPERARLEVEYQLLAARARFEGWAWGVFPYGHGLWFARVEGLWMYDGKGNPGIGDTPPAYIRALAERAERRIAG